MQPIETNYRGYRFRSRLEARWAVFFDALHIVWDYETQGFELAGGERYLPDFFLPGLESESGMYVEVKPDGSRGSDFRKAIRFACGQDVPVLMALGAPAFGPHTLCSRDASV